MTSVYEQGPVPEGTTARLAEAVNAVCRSEGVSIGRWNDRSTWRLDHAPEATEEEIAAARAIMATFDPWGAGDDLGALPALPANEDDAGDDEDEGQPAASEIFTEEDVEALGAVAAEGGGEPVPGNPEDDAGPGEQEQVAGAAYPGIAIEQLSDEVSIRRAQVIDRITAIEEIRLDGLEDRLAARDEAIRNYNNWPAGVAMDPTVEAAAREWMQLDALASAIRRHASNLRRSARDASADILAAMHADLGNGWPGAQP